MNNHVKQINRKLYGLLNLPKIFDSRGNAELIITNSAQLPITREKGVLFSFGLIFFMHGAVQRPIDDVNIKYIIKIISSAAPNGPNFDKELTPRVNCQNNQKRTLLFLLYSNQLNRQITSKKLFSYLLQLVSQKAGLEQTHLALPGQ